MAIIQSLLVAAALLSNFAIAMPQGGPIETCFSYTETVAATGTFNCPMETACGVVPDCIVLETLTIPASTSICPSTPTVTVTADACTTCQTGCATSVTTVTAA